MNLTIKKFIKNNLNEEQLFAENFTKKVVFLSFDLNIKTAHTINNYIQINPTMSNLYKNKSLFDKAYSHFKLFNVNPSEIERLKIITRALNIHECLHIIFSKKNKRWFSDEIERKIFKSVLNIIEDSYIERYGIRKIDPSSLKNILFFSYIFENSHAFNTPSNFISRYFENINIHIICFFIKNKKVKDETKKLFYETINLFKKARKEDDCYIRFKLALEITEIILKYRGFFSEEDLDNIRINFHEEKDNIVNDDKFKIIENYVPLTFDKKEEYSVLLKEIRIKYKNLYNEIEKLIYTYVDAYENKKIIGNRLDSRLLFDHKKRYWIKQSYEFDKPDFSVLFFVDSSGSMSAIFDEIIEALIFLTDLLCKMKIKFSIVAHQAMYGTNFIKHDILFEYNARKSCLENILKFEPRSGTRDDISLLWAKEYILENQNSENPLIFIISDGYPAHFNANGENFSYENAQEMKKIIRIMKNNNINIFPIALGDCYEELKKIYDNIENCEDISKAIKSIFNILKNFLTV